CRHGLISFQLATARSTIRRGNLGRYRLRISSLGQRFQPLLQRGTDALRLGTELLQQRRGPSLRRTRRGFSCRGAIVAGFLTAAIALLLQPGTLASSSQRRMRQIAGLLV